MLGVLFLLELGDGVGLRDAVEGRDLLVEQRRYRQLRLERQVPEGRINAVGYGLSKPIAPNDSEAGRRLNRRVEIIILEEKVDNLTRGEPAGLFEEAFSKLKAELDKLFQSRDKAPR